jgi:hypothetical protein
MKSKPNTSKKKFKERISQDSRAQLESETQNVVTIRLTREQALSLIETIEKIQQQLL